MLFSLWWGAVNGLIAWGEAVFLRSVLSRRPKALLWPCLLSMALLTGLATALVLSPLASLLLHLAALLLYARLALGARVSDCALPVLCLLVFTNLRVSLYTVLLSCLSRMLSGQNMGLALQILLSLALAGLQLWALWALSRVGLPWLAPRFFLFLPSALLLGTLWCSVGLGGDGSFQWALALRPKTVLAAGSIGVLGLCAVWATAAAAYFHMGGLTLRIQAAERTRTSAASVNRQVEDCRSFQHDLRNHMLVLDGLLKTGHNEEAHRYLQGLYGFSSALPPGPKTGNFVLDTLLAEKLRQAKTHGVRLQVDAILSETCEIEDGDLCTLVSNALDNAIRGAASAGPAGRSAVFTLRPSRRMLMIDVVNGVSPAAQPFFWGVGLANMRRTAEKYGGTLRADQEGNQFRLSILLCPQPVPSASQM